MKKMLFTLLVLTLACSDLVCGPEEWLNKEVPRLTLADGTIYTSVKFTEIFPHQITIRHAGGITRIPIEALNPEAQAALGFDPTKAAEARAAHQLAAAEINGPLTWGWIRHDTKVYRDREGKNAIGMIRSRASVGVTQTNQKFIPINLLSAPIRSLQSLDFIRNEDYAPPVYILAEDFTETPPGFW